VNKPPNFWSLFADGISLSASKRSPVSRSTSHSAASEMIFGLDVKAWFGLAAVTFSVMAGLVPAIHVLLFVT